MKFGRTLAGALLALISTHASAIGTVAGTTIQNIAQVTYSVAGSPVTTSSNASSLIVAEIVDVNVTTLTTSALVSPGSTQRGIALRVTNTGNGSETFTLLRDSNVTGDDFDPTPSTTSIYFDTDGSGDLSAADVPYVPGSNDPVLAPDASVVMLLVHDIPASVTDGQRGRTELTARSNTGVATPGTAFPGAGAGGVDAVIGTSGGDALAQGEYVVASVQVSAVKSQTVVDQFGGTRPIPGAHINYRVNVTVTGSGTATAIVFTDGIPANTSYVPGSLHINSAVLTDGVDADAGQFTSTPTNQVRIALGDLTAASGTQVLEFSVTIN